ncbi:alpha beta hydrolase family [Botrytis cinerea]
MLTLDNTARAPVRKSILTPTLKIIHSCIYEAMLSTGTLPQSLNSIHNTFVNIVPSHSLGIPISLFAGLATTSLLFLTLRDTCPTTHATKTILSKSTVDAKTKSQIIPSPLNPQVTALTHGEISTLPYPPDIYPGGRDIPSPVPQYGNTRAYEFGPVNGPKILLVHGISTPCIALHSLATALATTHGCRVLLFDLFGRGYSDGVSDLPHDERLYTTQILLVLTSSPLAWVGDGFHILGFSMGGGVAADFAVAFPGMGKMMRMWWFPDGLWAWILRRRVSGAYDNMPNSPSPLPTSLQTSDPHVEDKQYKNQGQVDSELATAVPASSHSTSSATRLSFDDTPISSLLPHITVGQVMRWQTTQHRGYANASEKQEKKEHHKREKILIIVGEDDDVIVAKELREDLNMVVGERFGSRDDEAEAFDRRIAWKVIENAGHEFPLTRGEEVAGLIGKFLGI